MNVSNIEANSDGSIKKNQVKKELRIYCVPLGGKLKHDLEEFKTSNKALTNGKDSQNKLFEPSTPKASIEFSLELKKAINERNILTSKTRNRVFEALDEIRTKSEYETRQYKKEKALLEIVNSEIKYVHQLEMIINFFLKPTENRELLKPDDFQIVFGHINTIYNVNNELLQELDKGYSNVAKAFSKIAPFFKLYSSYASDFRHILSVIQNARALNPEFAKFVENQESRPEVQNKLSALLITPIQRVPRYKMLLQQLHELTKPDEPDFVDLTECMKKINDAADHINKLVDDHENMQRLLELQRYLRSGEPNVIKPGRKLLKEGILTKMCTKQGRSEKLFTVLMSDIIMFNKLKKDELIVNSIKCMSIFPLSKCRVVEIPNKGCLRIVCQEEELILYHEHYSETIKWIDAISDSIENHLSDRRTLRKDSSSRRPVKRKDLHEYHEVGLSPGRPLKKRKIESAPRPPFHKITRRNPIGSVLNSTYTLGTKLIQQPPQETQTTSVNNCLVDSTNLINNEETKKDDKPMSKDLFVFGRPQTNSVFKFGKFLGSVGSTVKRLFGFKHY